VSGKVGFYTETNAFSDSGKSHKKLKIMNTIQTAVTSPERLSENLLNKLLLVCGILSSLWYVAINIIVPMQDPGYNVASQTVSELSAIGAPTRALWNLLCPFYPLLMIPFGWGVWLSSGHNRKLQVVGVMILIYGFSDFFWPPMHLREALAAGEGSMTDTMHIVFTMKTIALMLIIIGFAAAALGKKFRLFSIICILMFIVFGILTPGISANLPTPRIGIWERINIGVFLLWVTVFSIELLHKKGIQSSTEALAD
jgi:hypothetical protein